MVRKKYWLLVALGACMLSGVWMSHKQCCVPEYAKGGLNRKLLIVSLELTPDYPNWNRYLRDSTCIKNGPAEHDKKETNITCLCRHIAMDLAFIASYTTLFILMVWIIFLQGWKRKAGWILAGMIAMFDLLENLFILLILIGFEQEPNNIAAVSLNIHRMFNASLSKWTLLMLLVLWMFHSTVRIKGWWFTAGKLVLLGAIILFLLMPVWDLEQPVQVPLLVLMVYLTLLVGVLIAVVLGRQTEKTNANN